MELILHDFDLPLRRVFTIARGSSTVYRAMVVELRQDGLSGYGEAGENAFYGATLEGMTASLERIRSHLAGRRLDDPAALWAEMHAELAGDSFAQCALDAAAWDLWGKLLGQPLWRLWGLSLGNLPASNYTIGICSIGERVERLREFPGWPIYKIKLGREDDLEVIRELRRHTQAVFRVDANCGWQAEETIGKSVTLGEHGVEFVEQPLAPDDWAGMRAVFARSALPVIADESCQTEADVDRCRECFHGINIKLVKCGGLTPARRMIARARSLGLKVMVGCMTESTVGISAIAQLLPMLDYVDMDGAVLLAEDVADGAVVERGRVRYPAENGCGVTLRQVRDS